MFSLSLALLCLAMLALFGMVILLPIYLQTVRGIGSLATGLMLLPGGLLMGLAGPTVGRTVDRSRPPAVDHPWRRLADLHAVAVQPCGCHYADLDAHRLCTCC